MFGLKKAIDIGIEWKHTIQVRNWNNKYTPDISRLEKYKTQRLFVCDEHMSDRRQHEVIDKYLVPINGNIARVRAFTRAKFNYVLRDGIALPFPDDDGRLIMGELVSVLPTAFLELDKIKMNGVQFVRRRVEIIDPYREYEVSRENAIDNGYYDEDGRELPEVLAGKKGIEYTIGPEKVWIHNAWMYIPHEHWNYQLRRRPELFNRVQSFSPNKDKEWLVEYYRYQNID